MKRSEKENIYNSVMKELSKLVREKFNDKAEETYGDYDIIDYVLDTFDINSIPYGERIEHYVDYEDCISDHNLTAEQVIN